MPKMRYLRRFGCFFCATYWSSLCGVLLIISHRRRSFRWRWLCGDGRTDSLTAGEKSCREKTDVPVGENDLIFSFSTHTSIILGRFHFPFSEIATRKSPHGSRKKSGPRPTRKTAVHRRQRTHRPPAGPPPALSSPPPLASPGPVFYCPTTNHPRPWLLTAGSNALFCFWLFADFNPCGTLAWSPFGVFSEFRNGEV